MYHISEPHPGAESGGGITDAVHKAMLELGSHHKLRVDVRGLIDPKISLMGSNKMILRICCDIKPVATILTFREHTGGHSASDTRGPEASGSGGYRLTGPSDDRRPLGAGAVACER